MGLGCLVIRSICSGTAWSVPIALLLDTLKPSWPPEGLMVIRRPNTPGFPRWVAWRGFLDQLGRGAPQPLSIIES